MRKAYLTRSVKEVELTSYYKTREGLKESTDIVLQPLVPQCIIINEEAFDGKCIHAEITSERNVKVKVPLVDVLTLESCQVIEDKGEAEHV